MGISYKPLFRTLKRKSMTWTEICEELQDFYGISMSRGTKNAMQKGEFLPLELIGNICDVLSEPIESVIEYVPDKVEIDTGEYNVVFMGRCGAGKSSLINALIKTDLITSAVEEGTKQLYSIHIEKNGHDICFIDSPGTGANSEHDNRYIRYYKELVSVADCIVWVLQANVRADTGWQRMILQLRDHVKKDCNIIFCINQADKLGCDAMERWPEGSTPDAKILKSLDDRCREVLCRAREVCLMPTSGAVLPCSVVRNYNLDRLYQMIFDKAYFH